MTDEQQPAQPVRDIKLEFHGEAKGTWFMPEEAKTEDQAEDEAKGDDQGA